MRASYKALQAPLSSGGDNTGNGSEPPDTGATSLSEYANQYYARLSNKPNLQRLFKTSLQWFLSYCHQSASANVVLINDVTEEVIDGFIISMIKGQNLKLTTVSQYCNMLRMLLSHAVDENLIQSNPAGNTPPYLRKAGASMRQPNSKTKTYKVLFPQLRAETWQEKRTLAILGLILDTGLPASQILTTQMHTNDAEDSKLPTVSPDGFFDFYRFGKFDMCPLSDLTLKYYYQWLVVREIIPRHTQSNTVFIGRTGRSLASALFSKQLGMLCDKCTQTAQSKKTRKSRHLTSITPVQLRVRPWLANANRAP